MAPDRDRTPSARRTYGRCDARRAPLCDARARTAGRSHPLGRLFPLRQRALGAAADHRAPRPGAGTRKLWRPPDLHGDRRDRRGDAHAPAARADGRQYDHARRVDPARRRDGRAVAGKQLLDRVRSAVPGRARMDRDDGLAQRRRAGDVARLGQGARARHLSAGLSGVDGGGIGTVGIGRIAHRCSLDAACRCRAAYRRRDHPCMALSARPGEHARPRAFGTLARPAGRRHRGARQRAGAGDDRISHRPGEGARLLCRDAGNAPHPPPRRRAWLVAAQGLGRSRIMGRALSRLHVAGLCPPQQPPDHG